MWSRRIAALAAAIALGWSGGSGRAAGDEVQAFAGAAGWLNGPAPSMAALRGKVVLVDFWEYTCINCLRTLPYLAQWYRRYHSHGFEIVGIHTPEFTFSGEEQNVAEAAKRLHVDWPIALDDQMTIWKRFNVNVWPTELPYDQNGKLIEREVGEGNYQHTEALIQGLLKKSNPGLVLPPVMALLPQDSYTKPGAVCYLQTPETFVGPWHGETVANKASIFQPNYYADNGSNHQDGSIYLQGYWKTSPDDEAMISDGGDDYLAMRYHAIQVMVVMRPGDGPVRVGVVEDGKPVPRDDAGSDLQYDAGGNSYVTVNASRAYDVIMNARFGSHELRLLPGGRGLGVYDVAFESCEQSPDKAPKP